MGQSSFGCVLFFLCGFFFGCLFRGLFFGGGGGFLVVFHCVLFCGRSTNH